MLILLKLLFCLIICLESDDPAIMKRNFCLKDEALSKLHSINFSAFDSLPFVLQLFILTWRKSKVEWYKYKVSISFIIFCTISIAFAINNHYPKVHAS